VATPPDSPYRFGVFPYLPALTIDELFGPLATGFAQDLERPVQLRTKSTFELFTEEVSAQSYDMILVHPFFYVDAADNSHYLPLARVDHDLTAVVLVREDRPWHGWEDLAGRRIALPPALAAVSRMVDVALRQHGLIPGIDVTLDHYATKMSCIHAALIGTADACAVPGFIASHLAEVAEMKLRVMAEAPPIKHFVLAVHERVAPAHRAILLRGLLGLPDTDEGKAFLAATGWPRFVVAQDRDYDEVRGYRALQRTLAQR
jgi:ABC-type phosphate/phosphonate transport system substrate-binding protein